MVARKRRRAIDAAGLLPQLVEAAALSFDPWGDGKGDDRYIVFRNKIVVARSKKRCWLCYGWIGIGDRVRAQTEQSDGKVRTFRFCSKCVRAMGRYRMGDHWKVLERRYAEGRRRIEASRAQIETEL